MFNSTGRVLSGSFDEEEFSITAMEERYKYENFLIDAVSEGNLNAVQLAVSNFSSLAFEKRVSDHLRNLKNYGIIMNTLFRKAAERGGVHPIYIDRLSSHFAKEIEGAKTVKEISELMPEILIKYCNLVKKNSTKGYSPAVKKVIIKIESDLTADLTLNELAKLCNVTPVYLSSLFRKETGKTLTDFVNDKKIGFAKHLLKTTNLQVQTIAQHCGILDFHYFCRLFKRKVGMSPTKYREKYLFT
jgi:YesN/AraC family two-component response regulator